LRCEGRDEEPALKPFVETAGVPRRESRVIELG
jgi:hypothetical protein